MAPKVDQKITQHSFSTIICDQCGKGFSNVYTLAAHKKQVHEGIKKFACNICETKFATKYKLHRHHLGVHSAKRDFHCSSCGHSFKTRDMLIKHQRTHSGIGPFACELCDAVFKFKSGQEHHVKLKHTLKSCEDEDPNILKEPSLLYACSFCKKVYKTLKLLERHEKFHTTQVEFKCDKPRCPKLFKSLKELSKHEKSHAEVIYYSCTYCLKQYKSQTNFEIHLASHEKGSEMQDYEYVIDEENEDDGVVSNDTGIPEELLKNIDESMVSIVKIETERFIPDSKTFEEQFEILSPDEDDAIIPSHSPVNMNYFDNDEVEDYLVERDDGMDFYETIIAEELEPVPVPLNDDEADETLTHSEELNFSDSNTADDSQSFLENTTMKTVSKENKLKIRRNNEKSKSAEKLSVCDSCGATFKNNSHLKRHIQRKHKKDCHSQECDVCGSKFLLHYDLKRHLIKHSSNRDYECEHCDRKFKTGLSLKNHIKVLHNTNNDFQERVFECKICHRSYYHQRHLDYHTRKHTGDQRYKCDMCSPEKSFYYSDAVKWHKIRHHGEPAPFNCSICNKKFIHEKSLYTHEKEHQNGSRSLAVNCPTCGKSVSEKRHLKRHMRGHQAKEFRCHCNETFKERHQLTK